jgi:hypothetical protein
MERGYPMYRFAALLDELANADGEHPDVAVTHESEWSLTIYRSGFLVLENLEDGQPMHLDPSNREETLDLMVALAEGRIEDVKSRPWRDGYPPSASSRP